MTATFKPVTSISIARHALQFILRLALDADPKPSFGLIGRKNGETITHAALLSGIRKNDIDVNFLKNSDLQHILEQWSSKNVRPCGLFFSTEDGQIPNTAHMKKTEYILRESIPELTDRPVIHMPLLLNTAGCLEAFSFLINNDELISVPLILEEDGGRG